MQASTYRFRTAFSAILALSAALVRAQDLPSPLQLSDATDLTLRHRNEVVAADARAEAYQERPAIVAGLEDPMLSPSIDHYPFAMMEEGRRFTVEQRFPKSGVRGYRRDAARADARRNASTIRAVASTRPDAGRGYRE